MQGIFDAITEWIKELLIGSIENSLSSMFGDVNEKVGTIAEQVRQTPQGWNYAVIRLAVLLTVVAERLSAIGIESLRNVVLCSRIPVGLLSN